MNVLLNSNVNITFFHIFTLKKGCFLISSASLSLAPNLLSGFLLSNYIYNLL